MHISNAKYFGKLLKSKVNQWSLVEAMSKKHEDASAAPRKIIFVRNLPFETTSKELEEAFSDFGPIKQAFVVKDRDNASKCRGFGYVQFVLQDDADKALNTQNTIKDRKLKLSYANKKPKHEKRKKMEAELKVKEEEEQEEEGKELEKEDAVETIGDEHTVNLEVKTEGSPTKNDEAIQEKDNDVNLKQDFSTKTDIQKTIVLTGLTAKVKRKAFRVLCEKFGAIENIVYPVPQRSEVTAFVRYKDYKSTIRAVQKIPGQKVKKSNTLSAVLLTKEGKYPTKKALASSRLIIRNLDFKCTEENIREIFSKYGKIVNISIPTKKVKNRSVKIGCAFVQYDNKHSAKSAIDEMNLKQINGRDVVIDWAVSKDEYKKNEDENMEKKNKVENKTTAKGKKVDDKKIDEVVDNEETNENDEEMIESHGEENEEEEEEEDDKEDDDDGSGIDDNGDEDDDDEDGDDDDDEGAENDDEQEENENQKPKKQLKDAKEGKTVFIRNLSYNTEEEELEEEFEKYGEIEYTKIVRDPETGRSKGSAFIKFTMKEFADKCVESVEELEKAEKPLQIDGRPIAVSLAVTRGKLTEIIREKSNVKKETDKRNLYLAYEGVITKNSPGFESLTELDVKKRDKALAEKKTKLKNPNYFVSKTRLCIRNIPLSTDNNELRKILAKYGPDNMKIDELKIMRNKERKDTNGVPRSLGFGFVSISSHEHALALLRNTNNNPDVFGEKRRPIVEFSIENTKALQLKDVRKQRNEQKLSLFHENADGDTRSTGDANSDKKEREERRKKWWDKRVSKYQKSRAKKREARDNDDSTTDDQRPLKSQNGFVGSKQARNKNEKQGLKSPASGVTNSKGDVATNVKENMSKKRKFSQKSEEHENEFIQKKRSRKSAQGKSGAEEDKFNKLVSKYKSKLLTSDTPSLSNQKKKGNEKWFA